MYADEIRLCKQFIHLNIGDAELFFDSGDMMDIECDNIHADSLCKLAECLTDTAVANDAESPSAELDALAVCLLLPFVLTHGVTCDGDEACA